MSSDNYSPGRDLLRTTWTFQAIVAGPIFVWLGIIAVFNMIHTFDTIYDFFNHLCNSIMAGGIIFTVFLQRRIPSDKTSKRMTLQFEILKSVLATALWLWLLLDAIFGPRNHYGYYKDRSERIVVAAISSILLFILFYPTVYLAARDLKRGQVSSDNADNERTPLINEPST